MRYRIRADTKGALLGDGEVVIGRSSYCSLVLDHASISRVHASVKLVDGRVEISDLGSTNGTFVRGRRIKGPTAIEPGDDVRVGSQPLFVEVVRSREAADTTRRALDAELRDDDTEFETLDTAGPAKQTLGPARDASPSTTRKGS
ncbi:MAG TPA: FHA domain-containing protein [Minicystis sp.]|nr:FHA domain-containing protein [Minicystis sp.]